MWDDKTRLRLLSELIDAIQPKNLEANGSKRGTRAGDDLKYLYVHFFTKRGRLINDGFTVVEALSNIDQCVYYFGDFDLSDAHRLEVHGH